jgi:hypothetical protein
MKWEILQTPKRHTHWIEYSPMNDYQDVSGSYPRPSSNYRVHYERCNHCDVKMPTNESYCLSCGAPL